MRTLLRTILVLVAVGMALLLGLGALSLRPAFLREQVRDVLAQELAGLSHRQVQVGEIGGNLLTGISVDNLAIADEGGFQHGTALAAERVVIKYDLPGLLRGRVKAPASVKEISLDRAYVRLERSASGQVNLEKIFKPKLPKRVPPEEKFQPLITMRNSVVDLVAEGLGGRTLRARLTPVNASVKIDPVGPMRIALTTGSADAAFGRLSLQALSDTDEHYFIVQGRLEDLPLGRWSSLLPASTKVGVSGGSASADFQAWMVPSAGATVGPAPASLAPGERTPKFKREIGYFAQVSVRGLGVRVPTPPGSPAGLPPSLDLRINSARAEITPQGLQLVDLDAAWQDLPLRASGWVYDLAHPHADLQIRMPDTDLAALRRRLPPAWLGGLQADLAGTGDLTADVIGPLQNLNQRLSLSMPQGGILTTEQTGEVSLGSLTLQASLLDSAQPAVVTDLTGSGATLSTTLDLPSLGAPAGTAGKPPPSHLSLHRLGGVRAEALLAGNTHLARATVTGLEGDYEGAAFTGLGGDLTLSGSTLRAPRLQVDTLGGHLEAEALVSLPSREGEQLRIVANGKADHLELARLPAWPLLGEAGTHARGLVAGEFGFTWAEGRGEAVASLDVRDPAYEPYSATRIQALARADLLPGGDWRLDLPLAEVEAEGTRASVWGSAARDGAVDLHAELGGVDLATLPLEGEKPAGRAYGDVRLTGTLQQPELSGQVVVFEPRYQTYQASAVLADFSAQPKSLSPGDLFPPTRGRIEAYASYDTAVARAQLTLTLPATGEEAPAIAGDVRLGGARLESLPPLLGKLWPEQLAALKGRGQLRATVSGTTAAPVVQGELALAQVDYRDYLINTVRAPFTFELSPQTEDYLTVKGGALTTEGASLTFDGSLRGLFDDWSFLVQAQAKDIHLERLASVLPVRLPLAGDVFIPQITVRGSAAGITGEGRLLAPEISFGSSQIKGVDTHFVADKGEVKLERTSLQAAGGRVQAELTYALADRTLQGEVEAADIDLSSALALAAPAAAAGEKTDEAYRATERRWQQYSLRGQGQLTAAVSLHGPLGGLAGTASVSLGNASYEDKAMPDVKGGLAFDLGRRELTDINVEAESGQALMTVTGQAQIGGALSLVADATNVDLAAWRDWFPRGLGLGGVAGITVQAQGTTYAPEITASVDVLSASLRGVSFDLVSIPVVKVAEGGIDLDRIIFKRENRELVASGHLPFSWHPLGMPLTEPVSFTASVDNTDLSFFPPIIGELTRYAGEAQPESAPSLWSDMVASGTVNSQLKVGGTLGAPTLEGYLRLEKGTVSRPSWKTPLTDLAADVTVHRAGAGNVVEVKDLSGRWDRATFALAGSANLKTLERANLGQNSFDLALSVAADQQPLWGSEMLTGLQGTVSLTTGPDGVQTLRFTNMEGKIGKGSVSLSGAVNLTEFRLFGLVRNDFDVLLKASQVPIEYPGVLRGVLDGAVQVKNPAAGGPAVISGGLTLDHAAFGFPQVSAGSGGQPPVGPGRRVPDFGLDLTVALGSSVSLKTPVLTAPFLPTGTALVAQGSVQKPTIHGSLETAPSEGTLPGTSFILRGLSISYSLAPESGHERPPYPLLLTGGYHGTAEQTLPYVEVDGRNIGPVHLAMVIDGNLSEISKGPTVRVTAQPPLSQEQIAVLVGLQGMVPGGTTDLNELLSQRFVSILGRGLREALFTPIETQLRRALGLTEFTVLFAFGQPLEVRLSKYLVKNFLVSYRYSLIGPRNEQWNFAISYDLPGGNRVSYSTNESAENQFRVSRSWTF